MSMPRINTFTANLMHFIIVLAIVYIVAIFVNLVYFLRLYKQCKLIDYVPGVDKPAQPSLYRLNLQLFHKRSLLFIIALAPTTAFWPLTFAIAIPQYLVFFVLQYLLTHEWANIGMTRKQTYLPMVIAFLISLPLGRLIAWLYVWLPNL
jgi:hypothetical protein